jgi:uncharacterized protein DUF1259
MLSVGAILASATVAGAQNIDWQKVDAAIGRKANVTRDVHRYDFARSDLTVMLDGGHIKPALALGGWVAAGARQAVRYQMVPDRIVHLDAADAAPSAMPSRKADRPIS